VIEADIRQSRLYSEDLAPVPASIQNHSPQNRAELVAARRSPYSPPRALGSSVPSK